MPERLPTPIGDGRELKDIRLRILLDLWRGASRRGLMPTKDFIEPGRLGDLMGWIFLYRVERDPLRFLYLLCGPKTVRRIGLDLTGTYVDEHPQPEARAGILAMLTAVAATGRPHRREAPPPHHGPRHGHGIDGAAAGRPRRRRRPPARHPDHRPSGGRPP